ncbi:MAG: hypothetical protein C5B47_00035, partial [Verrucomicrobia bacterium]
NIDQVTVTLNLLGFLPWQRFVKVVHFHKASVNLPLTEDPQRFLSIRDADVRIGFEPNCVKILDAYFLAEKIHFLVRGEVFNPHLLGTLPTADGKRKIHLQRLALLLEELGKVQYLKKPPKADIVFAADLANKQPLQALNIVLHAEEFQYQSLSVGKLLLEANYAQEGLAIRQLLVEDQTGTLTASGTADLTASRGRITLQSFLNPTPYLREFAPHWQKTRQLKNLRMEKPPQIGINTDFSWRDGQLRGSGNGSAVVRSFFYKDVFFPLLELKLEAKGDLLKVQHLTLQDAQGKLVAFGSANLATSQGHFTLSSSANPFAILKTLLPNYKAPHLKGLYIDSPPQINVEGDVSWKNKKFYYSGAGTASLLSFSYNQQFFPKLDLKFSAKDSIINVERLHLQDTKGDLAASGTVNLLTSKSKFTLQSSVNIFPLLRKFVSAPKLKPLSDLQSATPPKLNLDGNLSWKGKKLEYQVSGSVALESFYHKKQYFPRLEFKFATETGAKAVHNLSINLRTPSGSVKGDLDFAPDKIEINASSTANPKEFLDFFDPSLRAFFKTSEIVEPPYISVHLSGCDLASLMGHGEIKLGRMAVRGAWIDSGYTNFEINAQALTCQNFSVRRGKGQGTGTVIYDFRQKHVYLRDIDSTMIPVDVLQWIDPQIAKVIAVYRFHAPPRVRVQGVVSLVHPSYNSLSIHIDSPEGLDYNLIKKTLRFGATTANVHIDGAWVKVRIANAELFRGSVAIIANVSLDPKTPTFGVGVTLSRVDFARLTKLYFNYDNSKGFVSGHYQFHAYLGKETDMIGSGRCTIEGGTVLSVPFLGPISLIMNQILPGSGNSPAKTATADFQVRNRKILTENLEISGKGFVLQGRGDIAFLTGKMDMLMRINVRGLPGLLFFPMSRLFEYESKGTIMKPEWRVKSPF